MTLAATLAVFGATGGTGRQLVERALAAGYAVRALVRRPGRAGLPAAVRLVPGDILDAKPVAATVTGADAVISCLGSRPMAMLTSGGGIAAPGTARVVDAMHASGVRRLIAVSTYGAGDSWQRLDCAARLVLGGLLRAELADKNVMEAAVTTSGLDWTIVRPVNLSNGPATGWWRVAADDRLGFGDWIARGDVAAFLLAAVNDASVVGRVVVLKAR